MNLVTVEFVGIVVQSILYGTNLILSSVAAYCMYYIRGRDVTPNKVVMGISAAMFLIITMFYVLSIVRAVDAFLIHGWTGGADAIIPVFLELNGLQVARMTIYSAASLLMDALLTYRLYIIYLSNIHIATPPIVALIGFTASSIGQAILGIRQANWGKGSATEIGKWVTVNMGLSVFICVYSTSLIIYRILRDGSAFKHFGTKNKLGPVIYIVAESALAYSVLIITMLVFFVKNIVTVIFLLTHLLPPLIGLNYFAVLIRIGLGIADVSQLGVTPPTLRRSSTFRTPVIRDKSERSIQFITVNQAEEQDGFELGDLANGFPTASRSQKSTNETMLSGSTK